MGPSEAGFSSSIGRSRRAWNRQIIQSATAAQAGYHGVMLGLPILLFMTSLHAALPEARVLLAKWRDAMYAPHETSQLRMTIRHPGEAATVREAQVFYRSDARKDVKILLRFTSPPKIRGTALLSLRPANGQNSDQWIYFPAYKKARRLSSRKKNDPFLDSDFSNGDISFDYHQGHDFKVLREDRLDQQAVYVVEGVPAKSQDGPYARQLLYIAKETQLNLKSEFYDANKQLVKELIVKKWTKYGAQWALDHAVMRNRKSASETEIQFLSRDVTKAPATGLFTLINLERGQ